MNIKDWQRAKEERKRSPQKGSPLQVNDDSPRVQVKSEVLEVELAAIASKPQDEEKAAESRNSR